MDEIKKKKIEEMLEYLEDRDFDLKPVRAKYPMLKQELDRIEEELNKHVKYKLKAHRQTAIVKIDTETNEIKDVFLTQKEAATNIGLSQATIGKYLKNEKTFADHYKLMTYSDYLIMVEKYKKQIKKLLKN